jgi:hypothetical protein
MIFDWLGAAGSSSTSRSESRKGSLSALAPCDPGRTPAGGGAVTASAGASADGGAGASDGTCAGDGGAAGAS